VAGLRQGHLRGQQGARQRQPADDADALDGRLPAYDRTGTNWLTTSRPPTRRKRRAASRRPEQLQLERGLSGCATTAI
jgi:hypothetical protein